jgi:hypothetical protein
VQCDNVKVDPSTIAGWESEINKVIAADIDRYIQFSQKRKLDLIGFGEMIHRKQPKQWRKIKDNWDHLYSEAKPKIKVHARIDHTNFVS